MNTIPPTKSSVNWATAPDAVLVTTASVAFTFGKEDAEKKLPCVPEMYFGYGADQKSYCEGYRSVVGDTPTTRLFLGSEDCAPDGTLQAMIDATHAELVDWMEEVAYLRGPH